MTCDAPFNIQHVCLGYAPLCKREFGHLKRGRVGLSGWATYDLKNWQLLGPQHPDGKEGNSGVCSAKFASNRCGKHVDPGVRPNHHKGFVKSVACRQSCEDKLDKPLNLLCRSQSGAASPPVCQRCQSRVACPSNGSSTPSSGRNAQAQTATRNRAKARK